MLKEATRSRHSGLDASPAMRRVFADDYTIAEYGSHLARLLGFFEPLEQAAQDVLGPSGKTHFMQRAQMLRDDLAALSWTTADIANIVRCGQLAAIPRDGILGYLYVTLGSMLGGRIIAKRLRVVLGTHTPLRFYGDDRGECDARWSAFCQDLELLGRDDLDAICATANTTFDEYAAWLGNEDDQGVG